MKNYLPLFLLFLSLHSVAQIQIDRSVIGSAGKDVQTSNIQISYNIGEVAVKTVKNSNIILTQGFEQNDMKSVGMSGISEDFELNAYPNPSSDNVILEIENNRPGKIDIEVFDLSGRKMMSKHLSPETNAIKEVLPFSGFAAGQYLIKVRLRKPELEKTLKVEIVK